jgi:HK97 family phage major capsid protein
MPENIELKDLHKALEEAQSRFDKIAEGKADATDVAAATKAVEDAANKIEEINKARAEEKAALDTERKEFAERVAFLEGKVARAAGDGDGELDDPEYKRAINLYLRKGVHPGDEVVSRVYDAFAEKAVVSGDEREIEMAKKDLVAGSGPDGGYFLTSDRGGIIEGRIFDTSPVRQLANVVSTSSDVFELILDDQEADSGWVGEVQSRPDTNTPEVGVIKIPVHELYAQPRATQKMLDDAGFDIEGWLARKVSSRIGRDENTAFVTGDGAQKPKGFLSYAAWVVAGTYQRNAVEQIETATASVLSADDLIGIQNALLEEYQANASWGMRRATFTKVVQLKDTEGQYLLNPRVLMEGSTKMLLGADVAFMSDMPAFADSALAIAIADWSEFYTVVDRFGIRVLRDPYTAKPYVKYYTTKRVGGAVTNYEAGKILKIKAA